MTIVQLKQIAKDRGLHGFSKLSKTEMLELLA
jgi:hypothetical protein